MGDDAMANDVCSSMGPGHQVEVSGTYSGRRAFSFTVSPTSADAAPDRRSVELRQQAIVGWIIPPGCNG